MQIDNKLYVAIDYKLTLASDEEVDSSPEGQPFGFITGVGQAIPGLESQLQGKAVGFESQIVVEPEEGYGLVNENLFQEVPKDQFPADCEIEPGMTFQAQGPHGPVLLNIKEVKDDTTIVVDLNHPLAGEQLHFDVKVVEVREPSSEELEELEKMAVSGCGCGTTEQSSCGCADENTGQSNCGSSCDCG